MKKVLRTFQSKLPWIRPLKFGFYNFATKNFGLRIDPEFFALRYLRPIDVVLDVGANWGQSIHAYKFTANPNKIVAFEPNRFLLDRLRESFLRDPGVEILDCALSDCPGRFDLFVPIYDGFVYDGLASLSEDAARSWLPNRLFGFDAEMLEIDRQQVPVSRLDDFEYSPNVVKIDVEGAEYQVVKGGEEMFRRCLPATIVEKPNEDLLALFSDMGLTPYRYRKSGLTRNYWESKNVIFLSDECADRISDAMRGRTPR